jgi:small subunit ribosomal protein S16
MTNQVYNQATVNAHLLFLFNQALFMLKIKLARIGKKKAPIYRLIISEVARDTYGRALENLGTYNPKSKELQAKADRINYWISQGAQMTITVNNLLVGHKIVDGQVIRVVSRPASPAVAETKADNQPAKAEPIVEEIVTESSTENNQPSEVVEEAEVTEESAK